MSILDKYKSRCDEVIFAELCNFIKKHNVKTICDYGCGDGELLNKLITEYPETLSCVGVDCWNIYGDESPKPSDTKSIQYLDNSIASFKNDMEEKGFDLVISTFALHHFKLPIGELRKIESFANTNGYIFLVDMMTKYEDEFITTNILWLHDYAYLNLINEYHGVPYTKEQMKDLAGALDCDLVEIKEMDFDFTQEDEREFSDYFLENSKKAIAENKTGPDDHGIINELFQNQKSFHVEMLKKQHRKKNPLGKIVLQRTFTPV